MATRKVVVVLLLAFFFMYVVIFQFLSASAFESAPTVPEYEHSKQTVNDKANGFAGDGGARPQKEIVRGPDGIPVSAQEIPQKRPDLPPLDAEEPVLKGDRNMQQSEIERERAAEAVDLVQKEREQQAEMSNHLNDPKNAAAPEPPAAEEPQVINSPPPENNNDDDEGGDDVANEHAEPEAEQEEADKAIPIAEARNQLMEELNEERNRDKPADVDGGRKTPAKNGNLNLPAGADFNPFPDPDDPMCYVPRQLDVDRCGPRFFVLGPFKGGTTSVYKYLSKHPGVVIKEAANKNVRLKETHFFTRVNIQNTDKLPGEIKRYMDNFPVVLPGDHLITGEASPSYIFDPNAPNRLHTVFPEGRCILMAREPIDRAYSQLNHFIRLSMPNIAESTVIQIYEYMVYATMPDMKACLASSYVDDYDRLWRCFMGNEQPDGPLSRVKIPPVPRTLDATASRMAQRAVRMKLLERGLYYFQLRQWHTSFPPEQILVVQAEDFYADTVHAMERIGGHVGLAPIDWADIVAVKYNVAKDREHNKVALDLLPEAPTIPEHKIPDGTRAMLQRFYAPYNKKFAEYTNMPEVEWEYDLLDYYAPEGEGVAVGVNPPGAAATAVVGGDRRPASMFEGRDRPGAPGFDMEAAKEKFMQMSEAEQQRALEALRGGLRHE